MKAVSLLVGVLTLSVVTVSSQPVAHAADEKADAKKKKKAEEKAKPAEKKPEEKAKPAEKKPEEKAKPAEKKPEEKKPEEKKPEEKKPETPAKPNTPPPGQVKPAEPKPEVVPEPAPAAQPLDIESLRKDRGDRRKATVARHRQLWGGLLKDERATAELKRHSFLVAALKRILALAESKKDGQTVEQVNALLAKEDERHARKMNAFRAGVPQ